MLNFTAPRKGRFSLRHLLFFVGSLCFEAAWLAPNHYPPWIGFHNEAAMFAALLAFCACTIVEPKSVVLPTPTLAFFAFLITLIWLQWAGGLIFYSGDALVCSLYMAGMVLAWWLGGHAVFAADALKRSITGAAALFVVAASVSSFMAVLQWLNLEIDLWQFVAERGPNRPYANLGQPNLLATLLVMGQVFAYLLYTRRRIKTWQFLALTVHLSFGLIVTESRAGLLSAICVGIFFLVRARAEWKVGSWRIVVSWWALLAGLAVLWRPVNQALLQYATRETSLAVDNARLLIWKQIIAGIAESPWLGYGWRQTVVAQKYGVDAVPADVPTYYAHNLPLDLLAWVGLPLGILLISVGIWWIWRTICGLKDSTEFLLFSATIPFFAHSMLEFPFAYAYFLFPIAWIFGYLHASQMPWRFRMKHDISGTVGVAPIIGLFAFGILCGKVSLEYLDAEEDFRVMRFEMRKVGNKPADYQAPRLVLLTQLDELLKVGRLKPDRGMLPAEIERLRKANLSMVWGALHMKYVIALGLNGQPEEASKQLRNIKALYGSELYLSAAKELKALRDEKYPELALVQIDI